MLVADWGGSQHGHWGEVLAVAAQARGIAGLLIDGDTCDAAEQQELGFPVFSRDDAVLGTHKDSPRRPCRGRRAVGLGDLVVDDVDGVVAIPVAQIAAVLDAADACLAKEHEVKARDCEPEKRPSTSTALYPGGARCERD